jgi:hypothetical protein
MCLIDSARIGNAFVEVVPIRNLRTAYQSIYHYGTSAPAVVDTPRNRK